MGRPRPAAPGAPGRGPGARGRRRLPAGVRPARAAGVRRPPERRILRPARHGLAARRPAGVRGGVVRGGARAPVRVLNQMGARITAAIQEAVPDVEVVEVPWEGELPDVEADVLVTLHRSANLPELARRVPWFHSFSTGVDGIPPEVFDGRIVTCSRGASAVPIS